MTCPILKHLYNLVQNGGKREMTSLAHFIIHQSIGGVEEGSSAVG